MYIYIKKRNLDTTVLVLGNTQTHCFWKQRNIQQMFSDSREIQNKNLHKKILFVLRGGSVCVNLCSGWAEMFRKNMDEEELQRW